MPLFSNTESSAPAEEEIITPIPEEEPVINKNIPDINYIVEDGSIVPLANSYVTLDYADEYCANKGYKTWLELDDSQKKISLIRGTEFVNNFFDWKGIRKSQNQSLAFPRVEIIDNDGYMVCGIPENLKKACIEASYLITVNNSDTLFSTKDENGQIKSQKVDTLEVEYFASAKTKDFKTATGQDFTSIYDILNYMLKGLYKTEKDNMDINNSICSNAIWEL